MVYDCIVLGCGFAGATIARKLAEQGKKVLILEQRNHIGGNCYDTINEYGILIHSYGPHIFHTNQENVYQFLSKYTKWYSYNHEVVAKIYDKMLPIPFNLNTLFMVYGEKKGEILKEELIKTYGLNKQISILKLRESNLIDICDIAEYVYKNIFLSYTMKQWGKTPEQIDSSVTERVPVRISYDNRYFQDKYQGMPLEGYTTLFKNMLEHKNITIKLNTDGRQVIKIDKEQGKVLCYGEIFTGIVIYTGAIDELFNCCFGELPYRSLDFVWEHYNQDFYQTKGVVNYTVSEEYTRITEFKHLTGQKKIGSTTIVKEYPKNYIRNSKDIPYYAIINQENSRLYQKYADMLKKIPNFYLLGRLAEYQYYNIDAIVEKALDLAEQIAKRE